MRPLGVLLAVTIAVLVAGLLPVPGRTPATALAADAEPWVLPGGGAPGFGAVAVEIDAGPHAVAAWQARLRVLAEDVDVDGAEPPVRLVGVESGEAAALPGPPRHDPAALRRGLVMLADRVSAGDAAGAGAAAAAPTGRFIAAVIHLERTGAPGSLHLESVEAFDVQGRPMRVTARLRPAGGAPVPIDEPG